MADRIWVCSDPNHKGVRAPGRMRKDDIRRFCIPCSQTTGYLVERHAPALERKRKNAKATRLEKERAQRERQREARASREVIDGVDIRKEVARLIKLPALRDELPAYLRRKVSWTFDRRTDGRYSGRAWPRDRVHWSLGRIPAAEVRAILCHELAHYVLPSDVHHDGRWARCYVRVVREAYGVEVRINPSWSKYQIDRAVIRALGGTGEHEMEEDNGG